MKYYFKSAIVLMRCTESILTTLKSQIKPCFLRGNTMIITAGKYKGRKLKTVKGNTTRPSASILKESLFSMLNENILNATFLDLFAGTGAVGLKAIKKKKKNVTFVEKNNKNSTLIKANIQTIGVEDCCEVVLSSTEAYLKRVSNPFDYVFMDPPYDMATPAYVKPIFKAIINNNIVNKDTGLIILECSSELSAESFSIKEIELCKDKKYSLSRLSFWKIRA